jgi:uncharacterized protein
MTRARPNVGLGLKPQHYADADAANDGGLWFEIHPENYFCHGGPRLAWLEAIRQDHPLSLHGVGLSLASDEAPTPPRLAQLRRLADRFEPFLISEHLAWSFWNGVYYPDLLPFPRTRAALVRIAANIERTQDALGRAILIENPSHYLPIDGHEWSEIEFLTELCRRTGCGLLVDVNNIFVSANNLQFSAEAYVDALPVALIGEIHVAGHSLDPRFQAELLIDSHDAPVSDAVWALLARLIGRSGARPVLIERDNAIPEFAELLAEREQALAILRAAESVAAA